ncbi:hypothetical protein [Aquimarina sp. 2201CG14-23]|uniref:hypothetical protein n=1 Tax=Aquimarina mycalae TaxID=3040073 RepID=UPI0024780796|nr:hypothetical protein [Aquimarina sp. 2201CG14-23]MDH7446103.1 hypothetical protein [Aquimarina sp. 2201CG14-23]
MNNKLSISNSIIIFGFPLLIIVLMIVIANSRLFELNPEALSIGITADLLFTVPFIYFLLIRKKNIPKITVLSLFIIGVVVTTFIIPEENQFFLDQIKTWFLPIVEIGVFSFVVYKVRKVLKSYRINKEDDRDFFSTLKITCEEILPKKISVLLAMEIAVFYYGFIYWKKRKLRNNEFSYHKNSGTISILIALIPIIGIETYVLHILLMKWSIIAAWIVSGLSIYSGFQIFGFLKSMLKRPSSIETNTLYLRYGILSEAAIDIDNIASVEISSKPIEFTDNTLKLSPLGELESHNMILTVKNENSMIGLYGIKRKFKTLAFYIDKKEEFKAELDKKIQLLE